MREEYREAGFTSSEPDAPIGTQLHPHSESKAMKKTSLFALAALVLSLSAAQSASAKECPKMDGILESLVHTMVKRPFADVRAYFGGKPGHKWKAFHIYAGTEFSAENTDFLAAVKYYEVKYDSLTDAQRRDWAGGIMQVWVNEHGNEHVNLSASVHQATEQHYAQQTAHNGAPHKDVFHGAFDAIRSMVTADTYPRFITYVKAHGLPEYGEGNAVQHDVSYKGCK
jgi:hypothetical protein